MFAVGSRLRLCQQGDYLFFPRSLFPLFGGCAGSETTITELFYRKLKETPEPVYRRALGLVEGLSSS
jgi:hypothetical protein